MIRKSRLLAGLALALAATTASAAQVSFDEGGLTYTYYTTDDYCSVKATNAKELTGVLVIPSTVEHEGKILTVTSFPANAFKNAAITEVTIPSTIRSIGNYAFYECPNLKIAYVNNSYVSQWQFNKCTALEKVILSPETTSIQASFDGCTSLTDINLEGVNSISSYCFRNCTSLKEVTLSEELTQISSNTFDSSGLTSITIPSKVTTIGSSAFYNCKNLEKLEFPEDGALTTIKSSAFVLTALKSVTIPNSVKTIESAAFQSISTLTSFVVPEGERTIGKGVVASCKALKSIVIPEGITNASWCQSCSALTDVSLPSTLKSIDSQAFQSCTSLTSITFPENLETICNDAFFSCDLRELVVPASVRDLGAGNFYNNKNLKTITFLGDVPDMSTRSAINSAVKGTGSNFKGCTGIEGIYFPNATSFASAVEVLENNFDAATYEKATLYVNGEEAYKSALETAPWNKFANIVNIAVKEQLYNVYILGSDGHVVKANVAPGEEVTLGFEAPEGREIESVTLNGEPVELTNGAYTLTATEENAEFFVTYSAAEAEHVNVTLAVGDHVQVVHKVAKGHDAVVNVAPQTNWKLESLTLNDKDVTADVAEDGTYTIPASELAEENNLKASFAYNADKVFDIDTSVGEVEAAGYKVYTEEGKLVISGLNESDNVAVYSTHGLLIAQQEAGSTAIKLNLHPGVYIILINETALKVAL